MSIGQTIKHIGTILLTTLAVAGFAWRCFIEREIWIDEEQE
jgi:hypothetical protein